MKNNKKRTKYAKSIKQRITNLAAAAVPERAEGQSGEEYRKSLITKGASAALLVFAAFAIVYGAATALPGTITVSSSVNGRQLPIYCVETEKKQVALTFDAAWGNEDTEQILETLQKHDVRVTFFMTGGWIEKYPEDVKKILKAGHDLGNHSENHKNMSQLTEEECLGEIQKAHTRVQELTGYEMVLFRPPYGDYDNKVITAARDCGYYSIQWDVETFVINVKLS